MKESVALVTSQLTKKFDGIVAVNNINLKIRSGEAFGLIGPNGAGKSTLLRMLATAEGQSAGEIFVFGENLTRDYSGQKAKRYIGYLPQDFPLYEDLSVWDYLDYFGRLYNLNSSQLEEKIKQVLRKVGLLHERNRRLGQLSGGIKQRIGLARSIIHSPDILILDEPTSGLDPKARKDFREVIHELKEVGKTIIISSHILSDLQEFCTSVALLEKGNLLIHCPLSDLLVRYNRPKINLTAKTSSSHAEAILSELNAQNLVRAWDITSTKTEGFTNIELYFTGNVDSQIEILNRLVTSGIAVAEFTVQQPSLDETYNQLSFQQTR